MLLAKQSGSRRYSSLNAFLPIALSQFNLTDCVRTEDDRNSDMNREVESTSSLPLIGSLLFNLMRYHKTVTLVVVTKPVAR